MRFTVLVNEGAGSVDADHPDSTSARVTAAFEAAGAEVDIADVAPEDFPSAMAEAWAKTPRPDAIVIGGGDGTVSAAAEVAAGSDMVISVLPLGTFNHFAKALGMAEDLEGAARDLVDGAERRIDVAEVNGHAFVNNSALGVYPAMVSVRDQITRKRGWSKLLAVPAAVVRVLRAFPVNRVDLAGSGGYQRNRVRTPLVFVGNGPYEDESGQIGVRSSLDDGELGLYVARVTSRLGLVAAVVRTVLSGSRMARDMDHAELTEVTVSSRVKRLRVSLDGEVRWLETPLRYRCRTNALRILAPVPPPAEPPVRRPAAMVEEAGGGERLPQL